MIEHYYTLTGDISSENTFPSDVDDINCSTVNGAGAGELLILSETSR